MLSALDPKNYQENGIEEQLINVCSNYMNDVNVKDVLSEYSTLSYEYNPWNI